MKFLVFIRALAAMLLIATVGWAQTGGVVRTMQQFSNEIEAFNRGTGNRTIVIGADFYVSELLRVNKSGDTLTIRSNADGANLPYILTRNVAGDLITIKGNSTLILENITFDGNIEAFGQGVSGSGSLFLVGDNGENGALDMKIGATIRNNYNNHNGSGVYIDSTGVFNMFDGLITGNRSSGSGGGVFIQTRGAIFRMSGGEISSNHCGSSAASYSGGVHFAGGSSGTGANRKESFFILGGTAIIKDNLKDVSGGGTAPSNVYMGGGRYVTLGDGTNGVPAPQAGMEVWITKTADSGVFVNGGASDGQQSFFEGDAGCSPTFNVVSNTGKLMIMCGYDIELDQDSIVFDMLGLGYLAQDAQILEKTVTVTNVGEKPTGKLVITLGGADTNAFVIDATNIHDLTVDGSDKTADFTVMPAGNLPVGTYRAFVLVSASMDNDNHVMMRRVFLEFTVGHNITWNTNCYGCNNFTPTDTVVADGGSIADPYPNVPTTEPGMVRQYYTFAGWYRDPLLQIPAFPMTNPMTNVTEKTTLHAKWLPKTTPIKYHNLEDGTMPSGNWNYSTYTIGLNPLPVPTRTGYTFENWSRHEVHNYELPYGISATVSPSPDTLHLWARWAANTYNITYVLNGGTQQDGDWSPYTHGLEFPLPTTPTRDGFVFGGWFDNPELNGDPVTTISETEIGDKTFWARWTGISLSPTEYYSFAAMTVVGYETAPTLTAVVKNTGNWATGALTVAISGANPTAFEVSENTINNIAIDSNGTFIVHPTLGLATGTYTAIITVSGANVVSQSFNVSFVVNPSSPSIISVTMPTLIRSDYVYNGETQTLQLANTQGNEHYNLAGNQAKNAGDYTATATLIDPISTIWADGTNTPITFNWRIAPLQLLITEPTVTTTRVYDGTNTAVAVIGTLTNLVLGDDVVVEIDSAKYNSPSVPQANQITVAYKISGDDVGNYIAPANFTIAGDITKADQNPPTGLGTIPVSNSSYPNGSITGVNNKMEFALDGGAGYAPISGTSITGLNVGKYLVRYAETINYNASPAVELVISYAPFSLMVNTGAGGTVSGTLGGNYSVGTLINVSATANPGFVFSNWTITGAEVINGNTANPARFSMPANNVTLTANFTQTYTVTFNSQGGTVIAPISNLSSGSKITEPFAIPTRSGFVFDGWYREAAGVTRWNFETDVVVTSNITLFAKWTAPVAPTFPLTVNAGANGEVSGTESGNYVEETTLNVTATANDGFHFVGWIVEGEGVVIGGSNTANPAIFNMPANAVTLTAEFAINTYTVTFNSQGGSRVPPLENVQHNAQIGEPTLPPTRHGFEFDGWYKEEACITPWIFSHWTLPIDLVTRPTTLFAKWVPANFYGILLDRTGVNIIQDTVYGAEPQTMSVNVFNIGNQPTGALSIALSGQNANAFSIAPAAASISNIAVSDSASFGITPNAGLNVGTYIATVEVSGGSNIATQSFDISFTVNKAPQDRPDEISQLDVNVTHRSLTLPTNDSLEYRLGRSGDWQDSPLFNGLEQDTEYWIFYRRKETQNYLHSEARVIYLKTFRELSRDDIIGVEANYGIRFQNNIVSQPVAIDVVAPENARISKIVIYDYSGNVVFTKTPVGANHHSPSMHGGNTMHGDGDIWAKNVSPLHSNAVVWNLTNSAGRFVANGTYLIVVEAVGVSGKTYGYTAKIGVRR